MTDFWQLTFPMPGQSESHAVAAENNGWDGLFFADTLGNVPCRESHDNA